VAVGDEEIVLPDDDPNRRFGDLRMIHFQNRHAIDPRPIG
jgi:hypothetical protein